jgi:hypothetical protein
MEGKDYEFDFFKEINFEETFNLPIEMNFESQYDCDKNNFFDLSQIFKLDQPPFELPIQKEQISNESDQLKHNLMKVDNLIQNNLISSPTSCMDYFNFSFK